MHQKHKTINAIPVDRFIPKKRGIICFHESLYVSCQSLKRMVQTKKYKDNNGISEESYHHLSLTNRTPSIHYTLFLLHNTKM